jgi:hypothetical protein
MKSSACNIFWQSHVRKEQLLQIKMINKISSIFHPTAYALRAGILFLLMIGLVGLFLKQQPSASASKSKQNQANLSQEISLLYFPLISTSRPETPFGIESNLLLPNNNSILLERTSDLGVNWVRGARIKWNELQANEGDSINWELLSDFEEELYALRRKKLKPMITIARTPRWASIEPTSCSAVRQDKLKDFGDFIEAIVSRYSQPQFNVEYWEFWNEPDVDPSAIGTDSVFGCWGDKSEQFYGGEYYGQMLKNIVPRMRSVDPDAKIVIGGLLLDKPNTLEGNRPELFFEGILRAGAAPYFDIVAYHNHTGYASPTLDYSGPSFGPWGEYLNERGEALGPAKGKPHFLRGTMARYGVDKPLHLNESTQRCAWSAQCKDSPPEEFFAHQPVFLTRMAIRSLNAGVSNYIWYTIHGPGWDYGGLLDGSNKPQPVYYAYQTMVEQIGTAAMNAPEQVDSAYPAGIEAYRFSENGKYIDALWSVDGTAITISLPQSNYINATDHLGTTLEATISDGQAQFSVGIQTIYIQRLP